MTSQTAETSRGAIPSAVATTPTVGSNRPSFDETCLVEAFTDILVGERSRDTMCFLDSIFAKANPHKDLERTEPDVILTDLFLLPEELMPKVDNTICAELGHLVEKLVNCVFEMTRPALVQIGQANLEGCRAAYEADPVVLPPHAGKARVVKWKFPDFMFASEKIVEVKYRFNSYQNKREQIEAALAYRKIGKQPVWLHISPDCKQAEDFIAAGWEVHIGQDAIDYIDAHTGIDFRELLARVAAQPAIRARMEEGRLGIVESLKAEIRRDIDYGIGDVQASVYDHLAASDKHTSEILRRRSDLGDEMLDEIRRKSEEAMDKAIDNLPDLDEHIDKIQEITGIFDTMNEEQQSEALSRIASRLAPRQVDQFVSTFG